MNIEKYPSLMIYLLVPFFVFFTQDINFLLQGIFCSFTSIVLFIFFAFFLKTRKVVTRFHLYLLLICFCFYFYSILNSFFFIANSFFLQIVSEKNVFMLAFLIWPFMYSIYLFFRNSIIQKVTIFQCVRLYLKLIFLMFLFTFLRHFLTFGIIGFQWKTQEYILFHLIHWVNSWSHTQYFYYQPFFTSFVGGITVLLLLKILPFNKKNTLIKETKS